MERKMIEKFKFEERKSSFEIPQEEYLSYVREFDDRNAKRLFEFINSHLTEIEKIISSELEMHGPKKRKTAWVTRRVKTD